MKIEFTHVIRHSNAVVQPACSECGAATLLVGIEQSRPGHELHTFECPACEVFETADAKTTPLQ